MKMLKTTYELDSLRRRIEHDENWNELMQDIPALTFPPDVTVKIIPPMSGAVARFIIYNKEGKFISVYLDAHSRLGVVDQIYWEAYPIQGDAARYYLYEQDVMMEEIAEELGVSK